MKSAACSAIASIVSGVSPLEAATPALSNRMTGPIFRKAICDSGVPMIHPASKMLHEEKRLTFFTPENGDKQSGSHWLQ